MTSQRTKRIRPIGLASVFFLLINIGGAAEPQAGTEDAPQSVPMQQATSEWDGLIRQLGARDFSKRQDATRALIDVGSEILPALHRANDRSSLEMQRRITYIISVVSRQAFRDRLKRFREAPEQDTDFPGWVEFRDSIGSDPQSVALFLRMAEVESGLFRMLDDEGVTDKFRTQFRRRCVTIRNAAQINSSEGVVLDRAAAMFFIAGSREFGVGDQLYSTLYSYMYSASMRTLVRNQEDSANPVRRVVGFWLSKPSEVYLTPRISGALNYGFPEIVTAARYLLTLKNQSPGSAQYGFFAIYRFGDAADLQFVEQWLTDKRVLSTSIRRNGKQYSYQVRDGALAVLIDRTGQSTDDYKMLANKSSRYGFSPNQIGFENDADRAAAYKRWAEWRAKNPRFIPVFAPKPNRSAEVSGDRQPLDAPKPTAK